MANPALLLVLAASVTWPPPWVDPADAKRVEAGQVAQTRTLQNGEIVYTITGRVEAPPKLVSATARDLCHAAPLQNGGRARYLSPKVAEAALQRSDGEMPDEDELAALPKLSCHAANGMNVFYVYVIQPGQFMMPDMRILMRQTMRVNADGSAVFKSEKAAGGISEDGRIDSEVRLIPLPDGTTAWALRGVFGVPALVPDFLVERWMDTPAEENPQLKRLSHLQARVREAKQGASPPPPSMKSGTRGG